MIHPLDEDIGRGVIYTSTISGQRERGVIRAITVNHVILRLGAGSMGSVATSRENLEWLSTKENSQ